MVKAEAVPRTDANHLSTQWHEKIDLKAIRLSSRPVMKRAKLTFEFALPPRHPGAPREQWLRDTLRTAIQTGSMKPGQCLPSTRELAASSGLSRGTVLLAIDNLRSEGYLKSIHGSGTYVADTLPDQFLKSPFLVANRNITAKPVVRLSGFGKRLRPVPYFAKPRTIAFRVNLPALDLFPIETWTRVATKRLGRASTGLLLGSEPQGYLPLRSALRDYLSTSRSVVCDVEQIVITSGIQESLDLATRILVDPGDRVLMEDPGYQVAYAGFEAAGARVIRLPIDEQGAIPPENCSHQAKLMYVTPGHQFPTGVTMSFKRRSEILQFAQREGTIIFEDDYDSEFRYSGAPLPSLQSLDRHGHVMFAGSFNKTLIPSLRLGYVVVPRSLLETFKSCKLIHSRHHPLFDQAVLSDFIDQGHFTRHLRKMRQVYLERRGVLAEEMHKYLDGALQLSPVEAGLQTVAWLKTRQDPEEVAGMALERNVDLVPLSRYSRGVRIDPGFQIGFAAIDARSISKGVQVLAKIIN